MDIYNCLMHPHVITCAATFIHIITYVINYPTLVQIKACFAYTHTYILPQNLIQQCNAQHTFMFNTHRL